ncbi:hypothetical protein ZWY2020_040551 [Hordeum vulgare]|nr:hypothetical protein ZWY2020_040551 [Hordeum vulgare]
MNIVKGVADLLRKSTPSSPASGGGAGAGGGGPSGGRAATPLRRQVRRRALPRVRFSDTGEEAILNTLWQRYENAIDKAAAVQNPRPISQSNPQTWD